MKVVKFKDGMYGIRKGNWFLGYEFKDLIHDYWWPICSEYFQSCCRTLSLHKINQMLNSLNQPKPPKVKKDYGKVVNPNTGEPYKCTPFRG